MSPPSLESSPRGGPAGGSCWRSGLTSSACSSSRRPTTATSLIGRSRRPGHSSSCWRWGLRAPPQKGASFGGASRHRLHHKHSDTELDVHSPRRRGFWYSHLGWIMTREWTGTDLTVVSDLAKYPELRALNNSLVGMLPAAALALAFFLFGGLHALIWGFLVFDGFSAGTGRSPVNSLAHVFPARQLAMRPATTRGTTGSSRS